MTEQTEQKGRFALIRAASAFWSELTGRAQRAALREDQRLRAQQIRDLKAFLEDLLLFQPIKNYPDRLANARAIASNLQESELSGIAEIDQRYTDLLSGLMSAQDSFYLLGTEPTESERILSIRQARDMVFDDPLVARAISVWADFGFGIHVQVQPKDENAAEHWDNFWESNSRFLNDARLSELSDVLLTDGELFFVFFTSEITGETTLRFFVTDEVTGLVKHPEDSATVLYYKRSVLESPTGVSDALGSTFAQAAMAGTQNEVWYRDWRATDEEVATVEVPTGTKLADDLHEDGRTQVRVMQVVRRRRGLKGERGWPLTRPSLPWARAYRDFLQDRLAVARAVAMVVDTLSIKGGTRAVDEMRAKFGSAITNAATSILAGFQGETNPPAVAGSTFIQNEAVQRDRLTQTTGAADAQVDGLTVVGHFGAGMSISPHFLGRPDAMQNRATARELETPFMRAMERYQLFWTQTFQDLADYVLGAIEDNTNVTFETKLVDVTTDSLIDTTVDDIKIGVDILTALSGLGLSADLVAKAAVSLMRMTLTALGVRDVDEVLGIEDTDDGIEEPTEELNALAEIFKVAGRNVRDGLIELDDIAEYVLDEAGDLLQLSLDEGGKGSGWFAHAGHVPGSQGGKRFQISKAESSALGKIKSDGQVKVQLGPRTVTVLPHKLTGKAITLKASNSRGFVLGIRQGYKPSQAHAFIIRSQRRTFNASRGTFKVNDGVSLVVEEGKGPGRGWWGPDKGGTHGPGSQGGKAHSKAAKLKKVPDHVWERAEQRTNYTEVWRTIQSLRRAPPRLPASRAQKWSLRLPRNQGFLVGNNSIVRTVLGPTMVPKAGSLEIAMGRESSDLWPRETWYVPSFQLLDDEIGEGGPGSGWFASNPDNPHIPGSQGGPTKGAKGSRSFSDAASAGAIASDSELAGGSADVHLVEYEDDGTGVWKGVVDLGSPGHNGENEVAVRDIANGLGMDIVPETVYSQRQGQRGTSQRFVDGAETGDQVCYYSPTKNPYYEVDGAVADRTSVAQVADMMLLDFVVGNGDRHGGNYLVKGSKLWAIGHGHAKFDVQQVNARTALWPDWDLFTPGQRHSWEAHVTNRANQWRTQFPTLLEFNRGTIGLGRQDINTLGGGFYKKNAANGLYNAFANLQNIIEEFAD